MPAVSHRRLERKSLTKPDETRDFANGRIDLVTMEDGGAIGLATFKKGWRWSEAVKPIAGTDRCEVAHEGYVVSGRLRIRMEDGTEDEFGPGDVMAVPPGHDAWTVGDDACVMLDWAGAKNYAR